MWNRGYAQKVTQSNLHSDWGCSAEHLYNSPRFLVYKHKDSQALDVLSYIRGDGSRTHPDVLMEYIEIKQNIRFAEKYSRQYFWRLFRKGPENNRKRLLLGIAAQTFQQLTGANALL